MSHAHPSFSASAESEADGPFLRRILIGLVAATFLSGAVALALASQQEPVEAVQLAGVHGPA